MRSLVNQLNQASDVYYNGKGEILTDYEWDALFDQLKKLEEETGEILPDSPTNKVSEDTIGGAAMVDDTDTVLVIGRPNSICISAKDMPILSRTAVGNAIIKASQIAFVAKF